MITEEFADLRCQINPHLHHMLVARHANTRDTGIYQVKEFYRTQDGENRHDAQIHFAEDVRFEVHSRNLSPHVYSDTNNLSFCVFALFSVYCTTINRQSLVVPDFFLLVTKDFQSVLEGAKNEALPNREQAGRTSYYTKFVNSISDLLVMPFIYQRLKKYTSPVIAVLGS